MSLPSFGLQTISIALGDWPKGKLLEFDSCQIDDKVGIERRNLEGEWFGLIRPVAHARIPPIDLTTYLTN